MIDGRKNRRVDRELLVSHCRLCCSAVLGALTHCLRRAGASLLLAVLCGVAMHADAKPITSEDDVRAVNQTLDQIDQNVLHGAADVTLTATWLKQLAGYKDLITECLSSGAAQLTNTALRIQSLGPPARSEAADVKRARAALTKAKTTQETLVSSCKLLQLRDDDLTRMISGMQRDLLTRRLLARGPNLTSLLKENVRQAPDWIAASREYWGRQSGLERLTEDDGFTLAGLALSGLIAGLVLRRLIRRVAAPQATPDNGGATLYRAAGLALARYLPALLAGILLAAFFYSSANHTVELSLVSLAAYGLPVFVLLLFLFRLFIVTLTAPGQPLELPPKVAKPLLFGLALLAFLLYLGFLLFATLVEQALPDPAMLLLRALFIVVFALNLFWVLWLLGDAPYLSRVRWPRRSIELVLLVIVIAEWLGYRNLSLSAVRDLAGTLLLVGLATLVSRLLQELYDGLESGRRRWQERLRLALGIKPGASVPIVSWLRPLTAITLWSATLLGLLWTWGLSAVGFQQLETFVLQGFTVGSLHIVPARILLAVFTLAVLLAFSTWFKGRLENNWVKRTKLERSAREALVTVSGYVGSALAVLVTLGIAGMEYSNLAIVAGALSVGIGFGLQNIVNNFVSGLILLFERPIKTGDWIVVGDTEGYVVKISIRSTQIQTFDQADVIVPNSELISGKVTNWMLRDPRGRVKIPVSVAEDSDTTLAKNLLIELAQQHALVVTDGSAPEPNVVFKSFGESGLDLELRCFIVNIDNRMQVLSDLNFAIDAAFREHGIEMSFPQRHVHIRSWPGPPPVGPAGNGAG